MKRRGAERERWHVGQVAQPRIAGQPQHRARSDQLLQIRGRRIVRLQQRGAQRGQAHRAAPLRCAGSTRDRPARRRGQGWSAPRPVNSPSPAPPRMTNGLNAEPGWRRLRTGAVVGAARSWRPHHREDVARSPDRSRRGRLRVPGGGDGRAARDRPLRGVLHRRQERGVHLPVGRVVAAELVAELLAEKFLRVPRRARRSAAGTAGSGRAPRAASSCAAVISPCARICASTR